MCALDPLEKDPCTMHLNILTNKNFNQLKSSADLDVINWNFNDEGNTKTHCTLEIKWVSDWLECLAGIWSIECEWITYRWRGKI